MSLWPRGTAVEVHAEGPVSILTVTVNQIIVEGVHSCLEDVGDLWGGGFDIF